MSGGYVHSPAPFSLVISPRHHLCVLITRWIFADLLLTYPHTRHRPVPLQLWPPVPVPAVSFESGLGASSQNGVVDWLQRKSICYSEVCRTNADFTHDLSHVNPPVSSSKLNFINFEALLSLLMIYFFLKRMFLSIYIAPFRNKFQSAEYKEKVTINNDI